MDEITRNFLALHLYFKKTSADIKQPIKRHIIDILQETIALMRAQKIPLYDPLYELYMTASEIITDPSTRTERIEVYHNKTTKLKQNILPEELEQLTEEVKKHYSELEIIAQEEHRKEKEKEREIIAQEEHRKEKEKERKTKPKKSSETQTTYSFPSKTAHKIIQEVKKERSARRTTKKINYGPIRQKAIKELRETPDLNPLRTEETQEYFRKLIQYQQRQYMAISTSEETQEIMPLQTEKDAYFAYQISLLVLNACASQQWPGFEKECREITIEFKEAIQNGYDPTRLKEYYGPEMFALKIIDRKELPEDLANLVGKLLPSHF